MTYLLLQTFLLLLSAYFMGALFACLAKRTIMSRSQRLAAVAARTAATPIVARPADVVPLAKPREIDPVQPRIDILPRPEPKLAPINASFDLDTSRFDRALSGPEPNAGMPRKMIVEIRPAILKSPTGPAQPLKPQAPKIEVPKPKPAPSAAEIAAQTAATAATSTSKPAAPVPPTPTAPAPASVQSVPQTKPTAPQNQTPAVAPSAPTPATPTSGSGSSSGSVLSAGMGGAAAAAAAAVAAAKAAAASVTPRPAAPAPAPVQPQPAATSPAPAPAAPKPIAPVEASKPAPVPAAPVEAKPPAPATPTAVSTPTQTAVPAAPTTTAPTPATATIATTGVDDLLRIRAIDAETERRLHGLGIRRFDDIAHWTPADINRVNQALGLTGRIDREQWIEQAQILSKGGETYYSRNRATAAKPAPVAPAASDKSSSGAPLQSKAAPASGGEKPADKTSVTTPAPTAAAIAKPTSPAPASFPQGKSVAEMASAAAAAIAAASASVTRGIRPIEPISPMTRANPNVTAPAKLSDALKEKEAKSTSPVAAAVDKNASLSRAPVEASKSDDLKRIRGIGVLIEKRLNGLGVTSYAQVANWTIGDIDRVSQSLDFKGRIERENWVEQARILSSGGHTEFSRRVDRGDVESSRDDGRDDDLG